MAKHPLYFDTPSGMLHVCMPEDVSHAIHIQSSSEQILYWVEDDVLFQEDILMQKAGPPGNICIRENQARVLLGVFFDDRVQVFWLPDGRNRVG